MNGCITTSFGSVCVLIKILLLVGVVTCLDARYIDNPRLDRLEK
jgi:hypothetical protein